MGSMHIEALRQRRDQIQFIPVRHEEGGGVHGLRFRQAHRDSLASASEQPLPVETVDVIRAAAALVSVDLSGL